MLELEDVARLLRPLWRRVMLTVARGVVRAVDDSTATQTLQVELLKGEVRSRLERLGALGITAVPLPGAQAAVVFVGGNRDVGLVVGVEDPERRPKDLKAGEAAVYAPGGGGVVYLRLDGSIEVVPAGGRALRVSGDLLVDGDVMDHASSAGRTMADMRLNYDLHVHPDPQGGSTGPPVPQV